MRTNWPVKLYWAPYDFGHVISLGSVSSSFLLKRRSQGQMGCLFTYDSKPTKPSGKDPLSVNQVKQKKVFHKPTSGCKKVARNGRVARACVRFLRIEHSSVTANKLPPRIQCGQLRAAIRQCFDSIPLELELSIKTSKKLETSYCDSCESVLEQMLNEWKKKRLEPSDVDSEHLELFSRAARLNIDSGWNRGVWPYIPNGHASMNNSRCKGGNWNEEEFSADCEISQVISAGKPRIITMYSSRNTEILSPLHNSLYATLKRKGWLLVGSPTAERVNQLNGKGPFQSVDYENATDLVKIPYVQRLIEILIEKSTGLSNEEIDCLRVVGGLQVDGCAATTGQPMGSLMSFPLLCIINKTIVDLSLADAHSKGLISMEQFIEHRCLINGDDLLYREFSNSLDIFIGIKYHGHRVGLKTNEDKTMTSYHEAEINSTVFRDGRKVKKTNLSALFMGRNVNDVIGFAYQSSRTLRGFKHLVDRSRKILANQEQKFPSYVPLNVLKCCARNWRSELRSFPSQGPYWTHAFPVVTEPVGYVLSREESVDVIGREVKRLRKNGWKGGKYVARKPEMLMYPSWRSTLKNKKPDPEDTVLLIEKRAWEEKVKEKLRNEEDSGQLHSLFVSDMSPIGAMIDHIRAFKDKRKGVSCSTTDAGSLFGDFVPIE